jgi:DNA polymerase-3 subunit delta
MKLSYDNLAAHLGKQLLPVYLVAAEDPLLQGECAEAIRAKARECGFTERHVHFIERGQGWEEVRAASANLSLFASGTLLEIRMPSGKPGAVGPRLLIELLERKQRDIVVLILTERLDREAQSSDWVRAIDAHGALLMIYPIDAARLPAWLAARCRKAGLEPSDDALELLAARTEGNLLAADQEIAKLALLAAGRRIDAQAVLEAVCDSARFDVFELGDAVFGAEEARALRILAALRSDGTEATLVLWALVRELHGLWALSHGSAHAPRGRPRPPASLDRARRRAPKLPYARLTARAARADRMIKGRLQGDAWDELALLATETCGRRAL